jgi:hypothetical protein
VRGRRPAAGGLIAALKAFRGLPHRVEKVAERADGVTYDDSKGTNVGATVAALEGLRRKVVLIAGGDGKGQDFSPLKEAFARYARAVVLIGRDAAAIEAAVAAVVSSWSTPPTWTPPCCSPTPAPRPATWCCCRPPAPASTCSATTPTAPRSSSTRSSACPESAPHETRCQPFRLFLPPPRIARAGDEPAVNRLLQPLGQPRELDPWLIWSAAALLLLGLVMVFSASIATAEGSRMFGHQPAYFLIRHAVFLAIGVIAGVVVFQIPMRAWQEMAPWLFIAGVVLLLIVLIPGIGRDVNGARRWLPLGSSTCSRPS